MLRAALIALALILSAAPLSADTWDDAMAARKHGDFETAARLFRMLAEQGNAQAQNNLGYLYARGAGVPQDYAEAVKWYRKAAEQGLARAQHNLGYMYARGAGVAQDFAEAAKWYRKAADQGLARAQNNLGYLYAKGEGVARDDVLAHMWFDLAADQDYPHARRIRDLVAGRMTSEQIAEAQRLARDWMAQHQ